METNWIEKIKETVRIAMNKKLRVEGSFNTYFSRYNFKLENDFEFYVYVGSENNLYVGSEKNIIVLSSPKGSLSINYNVTDKENLELQSLILSIKEYREKMATSELEKFISENTEIKTITDINSLDDDD